MPKELRCRSTMHGILDDEHSHLEVKCQRRACGHRSGVVVLHTFDLRDGSFTTKLYRNPTREDVTDGIASTDTAVRSA